MAQAVIDLPRHKLADVIDRLAQTIRDLEKENADLKAKTIVAVEALGKLLEANIEEYETRRGPSTEEAMAARHRAVIQLAGKCAEARAVLAQAKEPMERT